MCVERVPKHVSLCVCSEASKSSLGVVGVVGVVGEGGGRKEDAVNRTSDAATFLAARPKRHLRAELLHHRRRGEADGATASTVSVTRKRRP